MILCVGTTPVLQRSMIFDQRLRPDEVNRAADVRDYASGKSVNVARVLKTLGEPVVALGFAGGERGAAMLADLAACGIAHDFQIVPAPTRQCVTLIDRAAGTATELVEEARPVHPAHIETILQKIAGRLPSATGCVLSGSLPPNFQPDFYSRCLHQILPRGIPIVLDTRGEPLHLAVHHGGFVVKLNQEELAATVGHALSSGADVLTAMRAVMPPGGAAVVTLGAGGAIAADERGAWRVRVPPVETRSAVGSGDAFAAGLVLGLVRGQSLADACAWGAACGAANAMTDLAGYLSRDDVDAIRPRVNVAPV